MANRPPIPNQPYGEAFRFMLEPGSGCDSDLRNGLFQLFCVPHSEWRPVVLEAVKQVGLSFPPTCAHRRTTARLVHSPPSTPSPCLCWVCATANENL